MINPYVIEGIVKDPDMLFGRRVHLRRLLRRVRAMDCVSVIGPPGIGKSSLLYQLAHQEALQETHLSLYLDLSDTTLQNPKALVERTLEELGRDVGRPIDGSSVSHLEQALTALRDEGTLEVLLCLDGIDQFAVAADGATDFLNELRGLGFARLASLVVTSLSPLSELRRERVLPYQFVRVFDQQVDLGLLSARDATRLIREPAEGEGVEFSHQAMELARELGGRHPLYLQLVGYCLFEQVLSAEEMNLEAVRERFSEAAFPHLHRLWNSLTTEERAANRYYAGALDARPPDMETRQSLMQKGVVEWREGEYRFFSEYFREVVRLRRLELEKPLPAPEEPVPPAEVQAITPEEAPAEVVAPPEEGSGASEETATEDVVPLAEERAPPVAEEPRPADAPTVLSEVQPAEMEGEPSERVSPQEVSSLAALGCYVLAITLDLLFIAGIVVARTLFQLPSREMYILIGLAAALPVLLMLLNRLSGDVWSRLVGWLIQRRQG